jgi:hypothetical protein
MTTCVSLEMKSLKFAVMMVFALPAIAAHPESAVLST